MCTIAFCEADPAAACILRRHWPGTPIYPDITHLGTRQLEHDGVPRPDLIAGGFPCQDTSLAGRGAGLLGARSGLWTHMERLVAECRPRWVVAENVPGLRSRGADRVCAGLEALGYACWPLVVGAVHAGAPHRRQRVWIVAHARSAAEATADPARPRLEVGQPGPTPPPARLPAERRRRWPPEPGLRRVDHGLSARLDGNGLSRTRVDRLRCLGNAAVPANAAMIGRAILACP